MIEQKTCYRCEWITTSQGVCVREFSSRKSACEAGWYATLDAAKQAEAERMRRLADDLLRQADALLRGKRSK